MGVLPLVWPVDVGRWRIKFVRPYSARLRSLREGPVLNIKCLVTTTIIYFNDKRLTMRTCNYLRKKAGICEVVTPRPLVAIQNFGSKTVIEVASGCAQRR